MDAELKDLIVRSAREPSSADVSKTNFFNEATFSKRDDATFIRKNRDKIISEVKNTKNTIISRLELLLGILYNTTILRSDHSDARAVVKEVWGDFVPMINTLAKFPADPSKLEGSVSIDQMRWFSAVICDLISICACIATAFGKGDDRSLVNDSLQKIAILREKHFDFFVHIFKLDTPTRDQPVTLADKFEQSVVLFDESYAVYQGKPAPKKKAGFVELGNEIKEYLDLVAKKPSSAKAVKGFDRRPPADPSTIKSGNPQSVFALQVLKYIDYLWKNETSRGKSSVRLPRSMNLIMAARLAAGVDFDYPVCDRLEELRAILTSSAGFCAECQNGASLKCGKCKVVRYCSAECQRAHWKEHKATCGNETEDEALQSLIDNPPWRKILKRKDRPVWTDDMTEAEKDQSFEDFKRAQLEHILEFTESMMRKASRK